MPPTAEQLHALIEKNKHAPFSYAAVGATRDGPLPPGYHVDRNRVRLGAGQDVFEKAKRGLSSWAMFDLGWVSTFPHHVDVQPRLFLRHAVRRHDASAGAAALRAARHREPRMSMAH